MKIKLNGFTLIEVMIVVVIVATLTAIAVPAYRNHVLRAEISEGIMHLSTMRTRMEQYFQDNRTYIGACMAGTVAQLPNNLRRFRLECTNLTANSYLITARSNSGFVFTVDEQNNQATLAAPQGWPTNNTCWITNRAGNCQ